MTRLSPAGWARLALGGIAAYAAIDTALVFLRPGFSVLHSAESDYGSAGPYAWLMDLNFVLRGLLTLAVIEALSRVAGSSARRRLGPGLWFLRLWAVASAALALVPDDPVGSQLHASGRAHLSIAAVAFVGVVVGTRLVTAAMRRDGDWTPLGPVLAGLSWGALIPALLLAQARFRPGSLGGLYGKLFLATELAWLAVCAAWALRVAERVPEEVVPAAVAPESPSP